MKTEAIHMLFPRFIAAALFLFITALLNADAQTFKTEVIGKSTLDVNDPEREALKDAFRNAVEKEIGVQVKSETEVRDFILVKDKIRTHADGYVKNWKILKRHKDKEYLTLRVSLEVYKGKINKELLLNGIDVHQVYDWIGKPRIIVLVSDYVDGKYSDTSFARNLIEDAFVSRNIRMMSSEPLKDYSTVDSSRPEKLLALGKKLRAEIIVAGKSLSNFSRELQIGDFKQIFYTTSLHVQAWNVSSRELLFSKSYMDCNRGSDVSALGTSDAILNSVKNCVEKSAGDIVYQTVKYWHAGINKTKIYNLLFSNMTHRQIGGLEKKIKNIPHVTNLKRRGFSEGKLEVEVEYSGDQSDLTEAVGRIDEPKINITSESAYMISGEVVQ